MAMTRIFRLKYVIVLFLIGLFAAWLVRFNTVIGYGSATVDYFAPQYRTIDDLFKNADMILIGKPIRNRDQTYFRTGLLFTTTTDFSVSKVVKQPADMGLQPGQHYEFLEHYGFQQTLFGKVKVTANEYRELKKGSEYIVFLQRNSDGKFSIILENFGRYNLDGTDPDVSEQDKSNVDSYLSKL